MLPPDWSSHGTTYKVRIRPVDDGSGDAEAANDEELALELLFARECGAIVMNCVRWMVGCVRLGQRRGEAANNEELALELLFAREGLY